MLAFFPWLKIAEDVECDDFKLIRYERGRLPGPVGSEMQKICDRLLQPFVERYYDSDDNDCPVANATICLLKNKDLFDDYDESDRENLFEIAEVVAFCGLAKREYFQGFFDNYHNADSYHLVMQGFEGSDGGSCIITRRRDGSNKDLRSKDTYKVSRPFNVGCNNTIKLDISLMNALIKALEDEKLSLACADAIFSFNKANTDSSLMTEYHEMVFMLSAMQRLFNCNYKEDNTAKAFMSLMDSYSKLKVSNSDRLKGHQKQTRTISEAWLRDFFQLRGHFAHGKRVSQQKHYWTLKEHLLFASYIIPLLAKQKLSNEGYYSLTDDDLSQLRTFEKLLDEDVFKKISKECEQQCFEWNRVVDEEKDRL